MKNKTTQRTKIKTTSGKEIEIAAVIMMSKNQYDKSGYVALLEVEAEVTRQSRTRTETKLKRVVISPIFYNQTVWLHALTGRGETHVPLSDFIEFVKTVPVVNYKHAPVEMTSKIEQDARRRVESIFTNNH